MVFTPDLIRPRLSSRHRSNSATIEIETEIVMLENASTESENAITETAETAEMQAAIVRRNAEHPRALASSAASNLTGRATVRVRRLPIECAALTAWRRARLSRWRRVFRCRSSSLALRWASWMPRIAIAC